MEFPRFRRSLLSQSPMVEGRPSLTYVSPDSATPRSRSNEGSSTSRSERHSIQIIDAGPGTSARISRPLQLNSDRTCGYAILSSNLRTDACVESGRGNWSFYREGSLPAHNLEKEFLSASHCVERNPEPESQVEKPECDMFDDDDQFFASLDLDAMEAQAAQLLRSKGEQMMQKNAISSDAPHPNLDIADLPTFDLGI